MRVGFNPNKDILIPTSAYFHQVVIPVYIPNHEGYFKESFDVFKLCLNSLFNSVHKKTYITIINNGCCHDVVRYLDELFAVGKIHQLIHSDNIGYINSMLKAIVGNNFPFFTNADSDVLFENGWQEAVYEVFDKFPKTGAVTTTPNPAKIKSLTYNILVNTLFSNKVKFTDMYDKQALILFEKSIGRKDLFNDIHKEKHLTIQNGNVKAAIGAGHFVVTYRSDIFNSPKYKHTDYLMGGGSDDLFDLPVVKKGFWRLSTEKNYTFHMGNCVEDWMIEKGVNQEKINLEYDKIPNLKFVRHLSFIEIMFQKIIFRILRKKTIWRLYLRLKGLSKEQAEKY